MVRFTNFPWFFTNCVFKSHWGQYNFSSTYFMNLIHSIISLKFPTFPKIGNYCGAISTLTIVKFSFSEKATKIWKNLQLVLTLLNQNNCFVKTSGRFFQILWPSYNVLTLKNNWIYFSSVCISLFLNFFV